MSAVVVVKGLVFAITPERIRNLDALLSQLNRSAICDPVALPTGIRYLLNLDGSTVKTVDELVDGGNYVSSSTPKLRRIEYLNITPPTWNSNTYKAAGGKTNNRQSSALFLFSEHRWIVHVLGMLAFGRVRWKVK